MEISDQHVSSFKETAFFNTIYSLYYEILWRKKLEIEIFKFIFRNMSKIEILSKINHKKTPFLRLEKTNLCMILPIYEMCHGFSVWHFQYSFDIFHSKMSIKYLFIYILDRSDKQKVLQIES